MAKKVASAELVVEYCDEEQDIDHDSAVVRIDADLWDDIVTTIAYASVVGKGGIRDVVERVMKALPLEIPPE